MMWLKTTGFAAVSLLLFLAAGCAVTPVRDRSDVAASLHTRVGHGTAPAPQVGMGRFPEGVDLGDGLSENEAVAVALWNNPGFQTDLGRLGIARAELIQAGLLRNPVLSLLFPVGPKQLEAGIAWQVESIWQRPRRVALAQLNVESVAEGLVQNGLDVVMQSKVAYVDLLLAGERTAFADERTRLLMEIDAISQARLRSGDISEIEADDATATALEAGLEASRLAGQVEAARARLSGILGVAGDLELELHASGSLQPEPPASYEPLPELPRLLDQAWAARPDLRAAELRIEAAGQKAGLARTEYVSVAAMLDANAEGQNGFESGPGVMLPLPLFDRGQGKRALAAAEFERAQSDYTDIRNRISAHVREAYVQLIDAREALQQYRDGIVQVRREAARRAESAHIAGEVSWREVLVSRTRLVETLSQLDVVAADVSRAHARLEHAIGTNLNRPLERAAR